MRDNWTLSDYIEELLWIEDEGLDSSKIKAEIVQKFSESERRAAFLVF